VLKISQNPLRGFGRSRRKGKGEGGGGMTHSRIAKYWEQKTKKERNGERGTDIIRIILHLFVRIAN
jgi:hypothetical protein